MLWIIILNADGSCDDDILIEISPQNKVYINKDNFVRKLMPSLRRNNLNSEESKNTVNTYDIVSRRNEIAALLSMANIARNRLIEFPKSYSENLLALKKLKGFSKERNAINFVKKQKELLLFIKRLADDMIPKIVAEEISNDSINSEYDKYIVN